MESNQKPCTVALTVQIGEDLKKELVEYCATNGLKIGAYVDKAIRRELADGKVKLCKP
jgi:hypothetical protein